jgi:hypothetical protein
VNRKRQKIIVIHDGFDEAPRQKQARYANIIRSAGVRRRRWSIDDALWVVAYLCIAAYFVGCTTAYIVELFK